MEKIEDPCKETTDGCFACKYVGLPTCPDGMVRPELKEENGEIYQKENGKWVQRTYTKDGMRILLSEGMTVKEQVWFMAHVGD